MRKLFVWGTGSDSHSLMNRESLLLPFISGFIDSNRPDDNALFYDKKVYLKEEIDWNDDIYIIIATRKYYDEITRFLKEKALRLNLDYTGYENAYGVWVSSYFKTAQRKRFEKFFSMVPIFSQWIFDIEKKIIENEFPFVNYVFNGQMSCECALLSCCCDKENNYLQFIDGGILEYDNIHDLAVIFKEILIGESYYFHANTKSPHIIDGGANIGLSIYYFKHIYPEANIIAFEPNPKLYQIVKNNIIRNKWKDVIVYPYALSDLRNEELTFYVQSCGLAGSLEKRNLEGVNEKATEIRVLTACLSDYLNSSIDYLKLDIEGSETKVLEEVGEKLAYIRHLFIEFHEGQLKGYNSISKITTLLEQNGFDVNISKASSGDNVLDFRPMEKVGKRVSEVIWAKNRFIPSFDCTYYSNLELLRINASILNSEIKCCEVYVGVQKLGKITQNVYVNDETTLQGSHRWNSFFTKAMKCDNIDTLSIKIIGNDDMYTVVRCDVIKNSNIPRCYTSSIGTKKSIVVDAGGEDEFLKKWTGSKINDNLNLLVIECASACNLRCKCCLVGHDYAAIERSTLSDEVRSAAISIITRFPSIKEVQLNGLGEPLLYEGFSDLCRELYEKTHIRRILFFTNGMLLNRELVDRLVSIPLEYRIVISIDGSSPQENNEFRIGSDYERVKRNLKYLLEKTVEKENFLISINNLQLNNVDEYKIPEFLLNDFGNIKIDSHKTFYSPELSKEKLDAEGISYHKESNKKLCQRCFTQATIRSNGDVIVCCWDSGCKLVMGNILETPFERIWGGDKYNKMRQLMNPKVPIEQLPSVCRNCHAMNEGFLYRKENNA